MGKVIVGLYVIPNTFALNKLKSENIPWAIQGYDAKELQDDVPEAMKAIYPPQYGCYPTNCLTVDILTKHQGMGLLHIPHGHIPSENMMSYIYGYMRWL